jgi:porin
MMETLGGLRPAVAPNGIAISGNYIGEVLGNPSGGVKQSTHYDGLLVLAVRSEVVSQRRFPC